MKNNTRSAQSNLTLRIVLEVEAPEDGCVLDAVGLIKSIKAFLQVFPWKGTVRSAVVK
jgi:hypothetical protein